MKLTKITLENFRSFKERQSIELAPVTLLFGPNSVGKSSVLMALAYVQQVLEKGHCDPQRLDALGNKTIGGFRSLVHGGDLKKAIKIRVDLELGSTIYPSADEDYEYLAERFDSELLPLVDFAGSVETFAFEIEVSWSQKLEQAYVRNYRVWINQDYIGSITCSETGKDARINELNIQHSLALTELEEAHTGMTPEDWKAEFNIDPGDIPELPVTLLENALNDLVPGTYIEKYISDELNNENHIYMRDIGVACDWGAIPERSDKLRCNLKFSEFEPCQEHLNYLVVNDFLSSAFQHPVNLARSFLKSYVAIGPVRVIPDFDYVPNPNPVQRDWADGCAAWDLLHRNPETSDSNKRLIRECNRWLTGEDKLNAGYELKNWSLYEAMRGAESYDGDSHYLVRKRHLIFMEKGKEYPLAASQLGTGVSQVLPVLAAAHHEGLELVSVEQPELHLHPRFQVELGDLFLECSKDRSFLIETHSEHLILRMLRRVRDNSDVSSSNISVVYLRPDPNGVKIENQLVTDEGDFEHDWPGGFFDERDEELF